MIGYLKATRERRSPENPSVPLSAQNLTRWLGRGFGRTTEPGLAVDPYSAMTLPSAFACVKVIAETGATAPIDVYRRTAFGKERVQDHPNHVLLHVQPNDEQTPAAWREQKFGHIAGWGNTYSFIERDRAGRPRNLLPLDPASVAPERKNGTLRYVYRQGSGGPVFLDPRDVVHVAGLGFNGLQGFSPITMARNAIGLGLEVEQFNAKVLENGAFLGGVAEAPGQLSDKAWERLTESLRSKSGVVNAFEPAIFEEGLQWKQIQLPKDDVFFLLMQKFTAIQVAKIYRIPPHLIGETDNTNYNNMTELNRVFMTHTMAVYFKKFEDELNRKLFPVRADGTTNEFFCEFNLKIFLRADPKTQAEVYRLASGGPWQSLNEVRRAENLNPRKGGDIIPRDLNQGYLDEDGNIVNPNTNTKRPVEDPDGVDVNEPEPGTDGGTRSAEESLFFDKKSSAKETDGPAAGREAAHGRSAGAPTAVENFRPLVLSSGRKLLQKCSDRVRAASKKHEGEGFEEWARTFFEEQCRHECEVIGEIAFAARGDAGALAGIRRNAEARRDTLCREAIEAHADGVVGLVCDAWQRSLPNAMATEFFAAVCYGTEGDE